MKIKLRSNSKLQLVKAVKDVLDLSLKEAKDLVDEQEAKEDMGLHVIVDSEKTEEQIKTLIKQFDVTCTPLSDIDVTETVKITSTDVSPLIYAVMKLRQLSVREATRFIREHSVHTPTGEWICVDVDMPRKDIDIIASNIPGIEIQFLDHVDKVQNLNDIDIAAPELANEQEAEQKLQKAKLQEVTNEDLGVSIHSIDEESIGWQCKILFNHGQATRVLAGLHDAKFNVTEALVMHEGNKVTMLVITKTFQTGTRKKDLEKFEKLLRTFIYTVCKVVSLEDELEVTKERAIEAFNELQNYE